MYGDSVLIPRGSRLLRCSEADGTQTAAIDLPYEASTLYSGVMSGSVLIQPLQNGICTVDFTDGSVTASRDFGGSADSDVAVIDDMAYFSVKTAEGESFYCVQLGAELSTLWQYDSTADITSPTVQGDLVIFGAGNKLVTCNYKDGKANEIPLGGTVTAAPFASQYAVFVTLGDSTAKLRLNSDGTLEDDSLVTVKTGANSSAPLAYNGKLYVTSAEGLHIIDSVNMEISHTLPDIKNGSDPIICRGNGTRVYTVSDYNGEKLALHSVYDEGEDNEPIDSPLALMDSFDGGRCTVSENGTMYFRDGIGRIFALTLVPYDVVGMVIKLVLMLALVVGVFIWLRMLAKRKSDNNPRF